MTEVLTRSQSHTVGRTTAPATGASPAGPAGDAAPADSRPAPTRIRRLPRAAAFWTVGGIVMSLLAASSAATPLYPVYQVEYGFSPLTLTAIFAVYVLGLLAMLLTVGRLSDHVGRRPVLAAALVVEAGAMAVFWGAEGTGWLVVARLLQGLATGAATGVLGAYLLDLQPADGSRLGSLVNSVSPTAGLAVGAVVAGALVQYGPHPTRLIFALLTGLFVVLTAVVVVLPETVRRTPGALRALLPRVAVPAPARRAFLSATPLMIATWSLGGFTLSLGGSVLGEIFGVTDHFEVGVVVGAFAGSGALAAVLVRELSPERVTLIGTSALVVGVAGLVTGLATEVLAVYVVAAVVAGGGFGAGFLGSLRAVTQLARPHERAALLSAVYVVSYLAFSIPALVAGVLVTHLGLRETALGYGAVVAVLGLLALAAARRPARAA